MIIPDLNLLIYAYHAEDPNHEAAEFFRPRAGADLVPDAHIAAIALEYNAEVHSNDSDFAKFPGVRWRNPLDMSESDVRR